jgi:tetratricopeptide (TPR) repeat protein
MVCLMPILPLIGLALSDVAAAAECETRLGKLVSVQGQITLDQQPASLDQPVCEGSSILTGSRSRAAVLLNDRSIIRLKENSSLYFEKLTPTQSWPLKLIEGWLHFFSPRTNRVDVDTSYLNAGVRGTEFVLQFQPDEGSKLWVLEGQVSASHGDKTVSVVTGQSAVAGPNTALTVQPLAVGQKDAVAWTLHYPPIVDTRAGAYRGDQRATEIIEKSLKQFRQNRINDAIDTLELLPEGAHGPDLAPLRISLLLYVGLVSEAESQIRSAPQSGVMDALRSIIELTRGNKEEALSLARNAVARSPESPAPHIALSYAHQAQFELELARADVRNALTLQWDNPTGKGVSSCPADTDHAGNRLLDNALAWSRLAELELSLGNSGAALDAAMCSQRLNPSLERAQTLLGFTRLVRMEVGDSEQTFREAIALDSSASLPRLGLGLVLIQQGALLPGVQQLEIAASLDPESAIHRSYLGKGYYELDLYELAKKEFDRAKSLDRQDPTPWLYDAFRAMTQNAPVDALENVQQSIDRNDKRAVYRSKLLLEGDYAVRATSLGRVYESLGFDRLALLEATRSLEQEPGNHSAHQLLSDANRRRPRHEIARVSELLQAQIRAPRAEHPVSAQSAESRLLHRSVTDALVPALNEYSRMFQQDGMHLTATVLAGSQETLLDELLFSWADGPASAAITQFHSQTEGYRAKDYQNQDYLSLLAQYRLSVDSSLQIELRNLDWDHGELFWGFDPTDYFDDDINDRSESWRLGGHHRFSTAWDLAAFFRHESADARIASSDGSYFGLTDEAGDQGDLQVIGRYSEANLIAGAGMLDRERIDEEELPGLRLVFDSETEHRNAYVYGTFNPFALLGEADRPAKRNMTLTIGGSYEQFETRLVGAAYDQLGFLGGARSSLKREKFLPKLGGFGKYRPPLVWM